MVYHPRAAFWRFTAPEPQAPNTSAAEAHASRGGQSTLSAPGTLNQAPTERVTSWANSGLLDLQLSSDYRLLQMTNLLLHPAVFEKLIVLSG